MGFIVWIFFRFVGRFSGTGERNWCVAMRFTVAIGGLMIRSFLDLPVCGRIGLIRPGVVVLIILVFVVLAL